MKISTKGRYGLMLMVDLAMNEGASPVSLKSVAERQELSEHYLEQLIAPLRNGGYVRSIRGAYGGYVLAKGKQDITVKDLILALEGPVTLVDEDVSDGLDGLWSKLRDSLLSVMESLTLDDLVAMKQRQEGSFMYYI
jgi:Rrf2 family cysteine metabolism transcriptional repressor